MRLLYDNYHHRRTAQVRHYSAIKSISEFLINNTNRRSRSVYCIRRVRRARVIVVRRNSFIDVMYYYLLRITLYSRRTRRYTSTLEMSLRLVSNP